MAETGEQVQRRRGSDWSRQWLGAEIKASRVAAGLSQQEVADHVDLRTKGAISNIENGKTAPNKLQLKAMCHLFGLTDTDSAHLESLLEFSVTPAWWNDYGRRPNAFEALLLLEAKAYQIRNYDSYSIPGLLQTSQYAEAVNARSDLGFSTEQMSQDVKLRMARQARVWAGEDSPAATFVIDEAALRRLPAFLGAADLRAQLSRLLDPPAGATVQVLPFSAGGTPSLATYAIFDLDFGSPLPTVVVHVEGSTTRQHGEFVENGDREEVTQFELVFTQTQAAALSPSESASWIRRMMEETQDE